MCGGACAHQLCNPSIPSFSPIPWKQKQLDLSLAISWLFCTLQLSDCKVAFPTDGRCLVRQALAGWVLTIRDRGGLKWWDLCSSGHCPHGPSAWKQPAVWQVQSPKPVGLAFLLGSKVLSQLTWCMPAVASIQRMTKAPMATSPPLPLPAGLWPCSTFPLRSPSARTIMALLLELTGPQCSAMLLTSPLSGMGGGTGTGKSLSGMSWGPQIMG